MAMAIRAHSSPLPVDKPVPMPLINTANGSQVTIAASMGIFLRIDLGISAGELGCDTSKIDMPGGNQIFP